MREGRAAEVEVAVPGTEIFGTYGEMGVGRVEESDGLDMDVYGTGWARLEGSWWSVEDMAVDKDGGLGGYRVEDVVGGIVVVDEQLNGAGVVCNVEEGLVDGFDAAFVEKPASQDDV